MKNSTDFQARGLAKTVSKLSHEAADALAEKLDLSFETEQEWRAVFLPYLTTRL